MKHLKKEIQQVYDNLDKILLLFTFIFISIDGIWMPINAWLSEYLLSLTGYLYLSYTNIWQVFVQHWWVGLLFLLLLLVNIGIAYLQILFIFSGIGRLMDPKSQTLTQYLQGLWQDFLSAIGKMRPAKLLFILLYMVALFPFLRRVLNIYFLNKFLIPQFILDYLEDKYYLGGLLLFLVFVFFYLAVRMMFALPRLFFEDISVKEAVRFSWEKTKRSTWTYVGKLIFLLFQALFLFIITACMSLGVQLLADQGPAVLSFIIAVFNAVVIRLMQYIILSFLMVRFFSLLTEQKMPVDQRRYHHPRFRLLVFMIALIIFAGQATFYFLLPYTSLPMSISHRGVNNGNGVQNTLESLEKTAKLKPDYIEMDIQETKDGQFVMMHDSDLSQLAGIKGTTHDFTLSQLTQMTLSENGSKAKMASFDAYLDKADQLGQKLLIEIKTSKQDSPQLMSHFLKKYARRIKAKGHLIHSLDYHVIKEVKRFDQKLPAYFILPYNSIFPRTVADGYTMEYSSLSYSFVAKAWVNHKKVLAWTVNDEEEMEHMITMEAEGVITDNLSDLKAVLKDSKKNQDYTDLLLRFIAETFSF